MYGILSLDWKPSAEVTAPPAGRAPAIYRGDTYAHVFEFWNDDAKTDPFDIEGDVSAQIRTARLKSATAGEPTVDFTVAVDGNEVIISLSSDETLELPSTESAPLFWDLQVDDGGTITTLLAGKVKVLDDVTREASGS